MTTSDKIPQYGSVEIYQDKVLGVGSYGKVCMARSGQLPCVAKVLHETMFESIDPEKSEKFEQEFKFLSTIRHPNIVKYLQTIRNPRLQKLAFLMELMEENLTKFLERSTGPLYYHIQLNICHDVALALSHLHLNNIIHKSLSSNNVMLIGEGSRAKVTDFGMSKLVGTNPHMAFCSRTNVYMPPEALSSPPHYTSKLDCFSHGVLTIQILTRKFPTPGDASKYIEDPKYPTGRLLLQFSEKERRKKDIELIKPDHSLLPIALQCLKDKETERLSADELCEKLAKLKKEDDYTESLKQVKDQATTNKLLQEQLANKNHLILSERADHRKELEREKCHHHNVLLEKDKVILDLQNRVATGNMKQSKSPATVDYLEEKNKPIQNEIDDARKAEHAKNQATVNPQQQAQSVEKNELVEKKSDDECTAKQMKEQTTVTPQQQAQPVQKKIDDECKAKQMKEQTTVTPQQQAQPVQEKIDDDAQKEPESERVNHHTEKGKIIQDVPGTEPIYTKINKATMDKHIYSTVCKTASGSKNEDTKTTKASAQANAQNKAGSDSVYTTINRATMDKHIYSTVSKTASGSKIEDTKTTKASGQANVQNKTGTDSLYTTINRATMNKHSIVTKTACDSKNELPKATKAPTQVEDALSKKINNESSSSASLVTTGPITKYSCWKRQPAPQWFNSRRGSAVFHDSITYFSSNQKIFSSSLKNSYNSWTELKCNCKIELFSMVILDNTLTTVGGQELSGGDETNVLLTLISHSLTWQEILPPMRKERALPACITTSKHLVVAGGQSGNVQVNTVEVLDIGTSKWSTIASIPNSTQFPSMVLLNDRFYLLQGSTVHSCSMEDALSKKGKCGWTQLPNAPAASSSLVILKGHVVVLGGRAADSTIPTPAIHCYDRTTNIWKVVGKLPLPQYGALAVQIAHNQALMVGGYTTGANGVYEVCMINLS